MIERHVKAPLPRASRQRCSSAGTSASAPCGVVRTRELHISANRPFTLFADGDPIAELPVTVRVLPGAVRMIVPR